MYKCVHGICSWIGVPSDHKVRFHNSYLLYYLTNYAFVNACICYLCKWQSAVEGVGFLLPFICVSFLHDISKTDSARITKLELGSVRQWVSETHLFWVRGQDHESQRCCHSGSLHSCEWWILHVIVIIKAVNFSRPKRDKIAVSSQQKMQNLWWI